MRKILINEAKELLFKKHGKKIEIIEYISMGKIASFRCCICGRIWKSYACSTITGGSGCKNCAIKIEAEHQKTPTEEIKEILKNYDCELLSDYTNNYTPVVIKYTCGHIGNQILCNFLKKEEKVCSDCAFRDGNIKKRKTKELYIDKILNYGFEIVDFAWNGTANKSELVYKCSLGHISERRFSTFLGNHTCKTCVKINMILNKRGEGNSNWKGGISSIKTFLDGRIKEWKKESMKNCNYRCVITGDSNFDEIHHLYPFKKIIEESISELGFDNIKKINEYSENQLLVLAKKIMEVHKRYPLGVCLKKNIHKLFHNLYGKKEITPENFYEFQFKIKSGEIIVN